MGRGRPRKSGMQTQQVPVQYDPALDVESLAQRLIPQYHPHLVNQQIAYIYKNKEIKKGGRLVIATASKCGPKLKFLCDKDFVIEVSDPAWKNLTDKQKLAVVDHELLHCLVDSDDKTGEDKKSIVAHDVEEFLLVIQRHGLFKSDLIAMSQAVHQAEKNVVDETKVKLNKSETTTSKEENSTLEDAEKAKKECITKIGTLLKNSGFEETAPGEFEKVDLGDCTFTKVP